MCTLHAGGLQSSKQARGPRSENNVERNENMKDQTGDGRKFASDHGKGTEATHSGYDEHIVCKTVVPPLPPLQC